jgi:hypothetical protein
LKRPAEIGNRLAWKKVFQGWPIGIIRNLGLEININRSLFDIFSFIFNPFLYFVKMGLLNIFS